VSDRGRISVNAGYQLIAQGAVLAFNLVASPIIVHGLGLEAYGILILVGITTSYFGFVELGLGRASVQLLARHRARGEPEDFVEVLWTATLAYLALGIAGAVLLAASAPLLVRHALNVSEAAPWVSSSRSSATSPPPWPRPWSGSTSSAVSLSPPAPCSRC
jgi:O-antigen/teichoic acid export membrane protein